MRIEDYGLIGDTQTAALVAIDGSIDWLCLARFHSGACFAALLGDTSHGRWRLGPAAAEVRVERRYLPGTLVLETTFHSRDGSARVIDCMPIRGTAPDVVRIVEGVSGRVAMEMALVVRFDYGSTGLGSFPQAFSHIGLVNTALNLSQAHGPTERRKAR
jgi:GH15 family glucan-1,4-alpha-glucosidase